MFNYSSDNNPYTIDILYLQKLIFDNTGLDMGIDLDSDCISEVYYSALLSIVPDGPVCFEKSDDQGYKYCYPYMEQYFALCREYGKRHQIGFKNNPYVKEAVEFINHQMYGVGSYAMDWAMYAPKKITAKHYPCLILLLGPEFWMPVDLVDSLFNIRRFFAEKTPALETLVLKEQKQHKVSIIPSPTLERREAA